MKTLKESILSSTKSGRFGMDDRIRKCDFDAQLVKSLENEVAIFKAEDNIELRRIILAYIRVAGNECSLNWIDTSHVTNMSNVFANTFFNGDISKWNTSNVKFMSCMFYKARYFNQDISGWDVSKVKGMDGMFQYAESFNQDISEWDVSKVEDMADMFGSAFNFNQDISGWNVSKVEDVRGIFYKCPIKKEYKPKFK